MSQDKKVAAETKLSEEEKLLEEQTAGFVELIAKTNTEKITKEILEGLSEDTDDSDSYDMESGGEDSEDRPWQPSHAVFGKSTIKQSHLDNMRGRYFRDFLHQITPEVVIRMGIFVWAVRSQGLEPSARCFCSMHELSYETKP
jgi:hypothetical protein